MTQWHYRSGAPYTDEIIEQLKPDTAKARIWEPCWRCGGLGRSEAWKHTGWTCYRCGGTRGEHKVIKVYTAEKIEKLNAAQEKAAATRAAKRKAKKEAEVARREAVKPATMKEMAALYPEAVKIMNRNDLEGDFLLDLRFKYLDGHNLTPGQAYWVRKAFGRLVCQRHRDRFIRKFEAVDAANIEPGRHEVIAALISVKEYESNHYYGGPQLKALWVTDKGNKIWGTLPNGVSSKERGVVFKFRATIEPGKDDPKFGIYKRPYGADYAY